MVLNGLGHEMGFKQFLKIVPEGKRRKTGGKYDAAMYVMVWMSESYDSSHGAGL